MKNRLGHTDIVPAVFNQRIGTVIDGIQKGILVDGLLNRQHINFEDGSTNANIIAAEIRKKFIDGIDAELSRLAEKKLKESANSNDDYHVLEDLLILARDTYSQKEAFNEGIKAGIINYYNKLEI